MESSTTQAFVSSTSGSASRWRFTLFWLLGSLSVVSAEWFTSGDLDFVLLPNSEQIHYAKVYLEAPGFIDLSDLKFSAIDKGNYAATKTSKSTKIDITVTRLPDRCLNHTNIDTASCLIFESGVGRKLSPFHGLLPTPHWCCSENEAALGLCEGGSKYGRQIINYTKFAGSARYLDVPPFGRIANDMQPGTINDITTTGTYAIIFSNCFQERSREVAMAGSIQVRTSAVKNPLVKRSNCKRYQRNPRSQMKRIGHLHPSGVSVSV